MDLNLLQKDQLKMGSKITDRILKCLKSFKNFITEQITANEHDRKIPKEKYMSP